MKKITDRMRLNWLRKNYSHLYIKNGQKDNIMIDSFTTSSLRQAIDAAMRAERKRKRGHE